MVSGSRIPGNLPGITKKQMAYEIYVRKLRTV